MSNGKAYLQRKGNIEGKIFHGNRWLTQLNNLFQVSYMQDDPSAGTPAGSWIGKAEVET